jgi:hypothetical protein
MWKTTSHVQISICRAATVRVRSLTVAALFAICFFTTPELHERRRGRYQQRMHFTTVAGPSNRRAKSQA